MGRFHTQILDLVTLIYQEPGSEQRWQRISKALAEELDLHSMQIISLHPPSGRNRVIRSWGVAPEWLASYEQRYGQKHPLVDSKAAPPDSNSVAYSTEPAAARDLRASRYLEEFLAPQGIYYICGSLVGLTGDEVSIWSLRWPKRNGPPGRTQKRLINTLAPHLAGRIQLEHQLAVLRDEKVSTEQALEALGAACLILDGRGRATYHNRPAAELLGAGDGLSLTAAGKLVAQAPRSAAALRRAVAGALHIVLAEQLEAPELVQIERASGRPPYTVFVWPLVGRGGAGRIDEERALVLINDPDDGSSSLALHLERLYALTPAEAKVAIQLLEGLSPAEIGARNEVSENTVRTQIKSLLLKTDTSRQGELVALIYRAMGRLVR